VKATTAKVSDADVATFLIVHDLAWLRTEYWPPRSMFVLADRAGQADGLRKQFIADVGLPRGMSLRSFLALRRDLVRSVDVAKAAPSAICTPSDLAQAMAVSAARAAERRNRATQERPHESATT
jgi:hypothetical protein